LFVGPEGVCCRGKRQRTRLFCFNQSFFLGISTSSETIMRKVELHFSPFHLRTVHRALAALLLAAFPFQQALQAASPTLPSGGAFTAGSGSIATSGNAVTIHQSTNRGVIDWRSFSIGSGGSVLFKNGSGATLNRVTGNQMSLILGSLQATGTIYLINPQGVIIGPNGRVKTGGDFVASTLNLPNSQFLSGGALVFDGKSQAFVKNLGVISSTGGSVFLIADKVVNKGTISVPNGSAGMAAGERILLADSGSDQRIFVSAGKGDVTNKGTIAAAQAELKANDGNIYALAGNHGGEIRATGTATRDGHIWLVSNSGTTKVTANISAQNADGRGGSIETSGRTIDFDNASIKTGVGGSWLVDPVDLTIDSSAASTIQTSLNGGTNVTESTSATGSSGYGTTASGNGDITVASNIAWNSTASLTLSAYRNINVQNGVTISNAGSGGLTLHADNAATGTGTVIFNGTGNVHFTGSGNVDLFYHPAAYPTSTNYSGSVTMGTGKLTQYMTVDTANDLQNINSNLSGIYALNTDIDASSIANFVPIAHTAGSDPAQGFSGLFDGQSHTINHLTMNDSIDQITGLFGQTSSTGIIRNVGLINASVTNSNSSFQVFVGGLVGENFGTISSSYVAGSVKSTGGSGSIIGGLAGENDGTISNAYSTASVSSNTANGSFTSIGGLVGDNGYLQPSASITSSLATGSVTSTGTGSSSVGGFTGENEGNIGSSYWDTQSTGQSQGDGLPSGGIDGITGQTTAQLQNGSLPSGFSSSIWRASAGAYPQLGWQPLPGLSVSGTVYNGTTPLSSVTVVGLANGTSFGSTTTNGSGAYTLTAPSGTTSVLTYLTGGYTGNTFSDNGTSSFTGVDIYTNTLRLINVTNNNYSGMIAALAAALGGNSGSNFLFSVSGGNLTLGSGANFAVISSVATNIDQSITGTGTVLVQSSGDLTINSGKTISASGIGTPLTLVAGGKFINNAGANALSTSGGGRWLVYSQNPANDTVGSLSYEFKQYNATYGSTTVAQTTGNGLLYTLAPSLTPSLSGSTSKTYDAGITATVTAANLTSAGALTGDTVTLNATGATYADKNQGSGKSVTATGVSIASATDSTGATVYGYQLSSTSASGNIGTINPATLTYTANPASRAYGAADPAFSGTVTGFVGSDTQATATTGTLSFSTPATLTSNVGSYAINGTGLTANNGNYTFQQAAANAAALTINPAVLSYVANTASRTYGNANPVFSGTVTGFMNSDTQATATTGTLSFTSPATMVSNVGSYAINGSGLTPNSNYTLQQAAGNATALTINPAVLTYIANAASRAYGAPDPAFSGTVTGFLNGETQASATTGTLSFTTPATSGSSVGSYAINGSGLTANNGNYTFQQAAGNATALSVTPAQLLYTANAVSRAYGSANPVFTGTVTGFVNGDTEATTTTGTLSFSSGATTASNVGSYAINGSGLSLVNSNYTLAQAPGNATALTINPAVLTYTANSASRTYGDANPSLSGTVTGFVNGETQASATTGTLVFTSPADEWSNVGSYAINGSGLTANNGNYTFQQAAGNATALTINPAVLTYTADTASRFYGSGNPPFTGTVTGFVNGETLASAAAGTLAFTSPATTASNVGTYAINGSGLTANNGNYTFQQAPGNATALTINPAQLLYTANAVSRTYGDANPALNGTVTGFVNGDTQASATTGTLTFSTAATSTTGVGSYAINGSGLTANSGNYTLVQAPGNATALTINPAPLTAAVLANDKVYDATTAATGQVGNLSGVLNGDDVGVNISSAAFHFSDKNVGNGKTVTETGATLNGGAASNYTLTVTPGTANITPATLVATVSASDKEYDAKITATGHIDGLLGVLGNDNVQADSSHAVYTFSDKNVGTSKSVFASGITLTGADAGNYTLASASGLANITPATLTASVSANSKTYDGILTTTGSLGSLTGILDHDSVTLNSANAAYAFFNPNAGKGKSVTATGATLAGPDAGNYRLSIQNGLADINPVPVTVGIVGANRLVGAPNPPFTAVYNGAPVPGVSIPDLLSSISFSVDATPASGPGTYTITGTSNYPNVDLTVLPGTLTINFASTPRIDPSMTTAKRIDPPPLSVAALAHILPPSSLGLLQVSFSTDWSLLGKSISQSQPLAISSFRTSGTSSSTYLGGIRPW
jgi:filamentous hemagglutinin family protein